MTRYLVTSALPYINGIKHLGNLAGSILPADTYAKFRRLQKDNEVLYICATDEHGAPAELAAQKEGVDVAQYCKIMHDNQKEVYSKFRISFDWFGSSHSKRNHDLTQHFYNQLDKNDMLEEVSTNQVYSIDDKRFLPDRYVEGICPYCDYDSARGDQCENCTRVLDPTELINPRSAISGSTKIEIRKSKHLFLKQSKMVDYLKKWIDTKNDWSTLVKSIANKWLDEGLKDRSITRDLHWGIPVAYKGVTRPGFEDKVFYVWFDAPIEYISATAEWADSTNNDWNRWWREDKGAGDVNYVQFMGKDNIPFHTVGFPITIFGSKEPWKTANNIKGFNWVNYYGRKFSTSQSIGVFLDQALEILPSDYWRWYLLSNSPESHDFSFTWESLQLCVNRDLADVLGNLISRVVKFYESKYQDQVPEGGEYGILESQTTDLLEEKLNKLTTNMENIELRKSAAELRSMWVVGNEYLQKATPWVEFKTNPEAAGVSIRYALNMINLFAALIYPFIPDTSDKIAKIFNNNQPVIWPKSIKNSITKLTAGTKISMQDILFKKIEDKQIEQWTQQFGGNQDKE